MSDTVISVENVSKLYKLGIINTGTFRGDLQHWWAKLRGLPDTNLKVGEHGSTNVPEETVLALNDVSFKIRRGEVVGIIGHNGAGKSTLLKILSRITAPTSGVIKTKGRIASMLEVGTGFHPELTGRENIFVNGAILGMSHANIKRKFDEIVDFSGVEKYIDTPVKRYSSGMYVRLAFAVAAQLEPDILVVDEVLAVGDIAFQKKCFDKMEKAGQIGGTVIIVSHNMSVISRLCERAILLKSGVIEYDGATLDTVGKYMELSMQFVGQRRWDSLELSPGDETVRLRSISVCAEDGKPAETFDIRRPITIEFEYWVCKENEKLTPAFQLSNENGTIVFMSGGMHDLEWANRPRAVGLYKSRCQIPGNLLAEGTFSIRAIINTMLWDRKPIIHLDVKDAVSFQVFDTVAGNSARGGHLGAYYGVVRPILNWETNMENDAFS